MSASNKLKESARRAAKEVLMPVKASFFLFYNDGGEDDDECKNMLIDALMEELRTMRPADEQIQGSNVGKPEKCVAYTDFGAAIRAVKEGYRIARKGWNGKSQYVELATHVSYIAADGSLVNVDHAAAGNAALAFVGTSGVQLGWLASQADMLAEDWYIVNDSPEDAE